MTMKNDYETKNTHKIMIQKATKKTRYPQTYQKSVLSTTRKATPQNRKFVKISNKKTNF